MGAQELHLGHLVQAVWTNADTEDVTRQSVIELWGHTTTAYLTWAKMCCCSCDSAGSSSALGPSEACIIMWLS